MSVVNIESLLSDARLVVDYAVRAGKLKDSALPDAVDELSSSQSFGGEAASQFLRAFSDAVIRIAPMTLVDLRAGRSPFDQRNINARKRWQVGLSAVTVLLISGIAFYQYQVQQQTDALQAYQEATAVRISEKVTAARIMARQALTDQSCSFNDYQRARHELRQMDSRAAASTATLQRLADSSPWPLVDLLQAIDERWSSAPQPVTVIKPAAATPPISPDAVQHAGSDTGSGVCTAKAREELLERTNPDWLRRVVADGLDDYCYADSMNLPYALRSQTLDSLGMFRNGENPVPALQQRSRIQTAWVLPFLYGLLGACVYVMRRLLFDMRAAVVENMVILLRLALGALAGVVIGWFATPTMAGGVGASSAVSWQYVLAFLAGFSIDNLFSLLDRLNRTLGGKDKAQPLPDA